MTNGDDDVVKFTHSLSVDKYAIWQSIYKIIWENQAAVLAQWKSFFSGVLGHCNGEENGSNRLIAPFPALEALAICFNKENTTGVAGIGRVVYFCLLLEADRLGVKSTGFDCLNWVHWHSFV